MWAFSGKSTLLRVQCTQYREHNTWRASCSDARGLGSGGGGGGHMIGEVAASPTSTHQTVIKR